AAQSTGGHVTPTVVAVIPAKNTYRELPDIVLRTFAGRPLIDYTLEAARQAGMFERILVTTDDPRVRDHCVAQGAWAVLRPDSLSLPQVRLSEVLQDAVLRYEREFASPIDIVALLNVHCPLRRAAHIREAVDTLILHNVDNVI